MSLSFRSSALAVSAAALLGAAMARPAEASFWSLLPGAGGQPGQASPVAAKKPALNGKLVTANGQPVPYLDGQYAGKPFDAYYGLVQIQANIANGKLESIDVLQWPKDRRTSRYINSNALPMLQQEVIAAQSAKVDLVSGATLTSEAFLRSLNSALAQASN
jgi:uncharacterized protein with FMN-binding domain